jgi:hypothetical protein
MVRAHHTCSLIACGHLFCAQIEKEITTLEFVSLQKKSRHKRLFSYSVQNEKRQ